MVCGYVEAVLGCGFVLLVDSAVCYGFWGWGVGVGSFNNLLAVDREYAGLVVGMSLVFKLLMHAVYTDLIFLATPLDQCLLLNFVVGLCCFLWCGLGTFSWPLLILMRVQVYNRMQGLSFRITQLVYHTTLPLRVTNASWDNIFSSTYQDLWQ